jgi:hypothetical protein
MPYAQEHLQKSEKGYNCDLLLLPTVNCYTSLTSEPLSNKNARLKVFLTFNLAFLRALFFILRWA